MPKALCTSGRSYATAHPPEKYALRGDACPAFAGRLDGASNAHRDLFCAFFQTSLKTAGTAEAGTAEACHGAAFGESEAGGGGVAPDCEVLVLAHAVVNSNAAINVSWTFSIAATFPASSRCYRPKRKRRACPQAAAFM